jgi:YHS domain-containing protein
MAPGKWYCFINLNGKTSSDFRELNKGTTYYFSIETEAKR